MSDDLEKVWNCLGIHYQQKKPTHESKWEGPEEDHKKSVTINNQICSHSKGE